MLVIELVAICRERPGTDPRERIPDPTPIEPITLQTGLAAGIADPIFRGLLAPGNDAFNSALQVLRTRNLAGRFWSL